MAINCDSSRKLTHTFTMDENYNAKLPPSHPPLIRMCPGMRDVRSLIKHEFNACLFMCELREGRENERVRERRKREGGRIKW